MSLRGEGRNILGAAQPGDLLAAAGAVPATDQRTPATTARPASAGVNHERVREAIADLPSLLRVADLARGFFGPSGCADGECEHTGDDEQCPLLQVRYATADDLEQLDDAVAVLARVHELAQQGLRANPAVGLELFGQIVDLTGRGAGPREAS